MKYRRIALWGFLALIVAAGIAYAFRPRPVPVDLIVVAKAPFVVSIDEEGKTRVRDVFRLSAPVTGRNQRIELNVGDHVEAGKTVVTRIESIDPSILDVRSQVQAVAEVRAAEAARSMPPPNWKVPRPIWNSRSSSLNAPEVCAAPARFRCVPSNWPTGTTRHGRRQ